MRAVAYRTLEVARIPNAKATEEDRKMADFDFIIIGAGAASFAAATKASELGIKT